MNTITATRTATSIEVTVDGESITALTGKATIARPFVAVSYASEWTPDNGIVRAWVATSHARADLAAKARGGNAHGFHNETGTWTPGENFAVVEVTES